MSAGILPFGTRFDAVLVSVTEKCQLGCAHCGFRGSGRNREADARDVDNWVRQACECGAPKIIFTGGEPFERFDCLAGAIAAARTTGTPAAVFTNAFWAKSAEAARTALARLCGLTHLYLSSDRFHQPRVPYQNVFNAIEAAFELYIPFITICITYATEADRIDVRQKYAKYFERITFYEQRVIPNPYCSSRVLQHQSELRNPRPQEYSVRCEIYTPIINPDGDVYSCHVGKAAAHRDLRRLPYFLGNLYEQDFAAIMAAAALRPDYQFLRTHGARGVATLFEQEPGLMKAVDRNAFTTDCDMCFSTLKIPEGRAALKRYVSRPEVRDEIDLRLALIAGENPLPPVGSGTNDAGCDHDTDPSH